MNTDPRAKTPYGHFSGYPLIQVEGERVYRLMRDFSFTDPTGKIWGVTKGRVVNGVTMPRGLWEELGPPVATKIFRASLPHDEACREGEGVPISPERRLAADQMFYFGCRTCGVSKPESLLLFAGVRIGAKGNDTKYIMRDMSSVVIDALASTAKSFRLHMPFRPPNPALAELRILKHIDGGLS